MMYVTSRLSLHVTPTKDGQFLVEFPHTGLNVKVNKKELATIVKIPEQQTHVPLTEEDLKILQPLIQAGAVRIHGKHPNTYYVVYKVTNACNLACTYCYEAKLGRRKPDTPRWDVFTGIVHKFFARRNSGILSFHGGEPTLFPDFLFRAFRYLQKKAPRVKAGVQTNGVALTDERLARKFARLSQNRFGIGVSLDGLREHTRERVFVDGTEAFDRILQGIENLRKHGGKFGIISVISDRNVKDMVKIAEFQHELGAGGGRLNILLEEKMDREEYDRQMVKVMKWQIEVNTTNERKFYVTNIKEFIEPLFGVSNSTCNTRPCAAGKDLFAVLQDGTVTPCDHVPFKVGHVLDAEWTPDKAMEDERLQQFWLESVLASEKCRGCRFYPNCKGIKCYGELLTNNTDAKLCMKRTLEFARELMLNDDREALKALLPDFQPVELGLGP